MSLPYKWIVLMVAGLLAASCGFEPMYGKKNQQALAAGVKIETQNDAIGHQFKQDLEDALNPTGVPPRPEYLLKVSVQTAASAIGVARDGTVSRYNVVLGSNYMLQRISDGKILQKNQVQHVSSFNNQTNQYYSTYISEKDAISRGIKELAELYRQRIGAILLKDKIS